MEGKVDSVDIAPAFHIAQGHAAGDETDSILEKAKPSMRPARSFFDLDGPATDLHPTTHLPVNLCAR